MKKMSLYCVGITVIVVAIAVPWGYAEMSSSSYQIPCTVLSGGHGPMVSATYQLNGTVGQSSPLMDPLEAPFSDNYDLYPGFWYAVTAFEGTCPGDNNGDKDVDGSDLADYLIDSAGLELEVFAADFGTVNCP